VDGQRHAQATLPPGTNRCTLYRKLGGPQGQSGGVRKISSPTGIRSPDCPARSQSLHPLSYPGPCKEHTVYIQLQFLFHDVPINHQPPSSLTRVTIRHPGLTKKYYFFVSWSASSICYGFCTTGCLSCRGFLCRGAARSADGSDESWVI